jgi:MoxR-like ATPase
MELNNYYMRQEEKVALRFILNATVTGSKTILISGVPGIGKTYLGMCLAETKGWPLVKYQCHAWSSDQELFNSISVSAVVKNDTENIIEKGKFLEAAELSHEGPVLLIVDELDKAPEMVDSLLYDFLQYGRVPAGEGKYVQADLNNLYIFITTNNNRELNDAIIRRCRRLHMNQLPDNVIDDIISSKSSVSINMARKIRKIGQILSLQDNKPYSIQEMVNLTEEIKLAETKEEMIISISAWFVKGPRGEEYLSSNKANTILNELYSIIKGKNYGI